MSTREQGGKDPQPASPAKFWLKSALVIVAVGILLAWAWMPSHPDEPVYQGKSLRAWLKTYVERDEDREAQAEALAALRKIGTNGIPTLLRMTQTPNSSFRSKLIVLMEKQTFLPVSLQHPADIRFMASRGFYVLAEDSKGAVPELLSLANRGSGTVGRYEAVTSLGYIGPSAKAAIPALLAIASDAKDQNRGHAIHSLGEIRSSAESVVPFLTSCLSDSDEMVRWIAAISLFKFGDGAKSSVPALIPLLADPAEQVRRRATNALKRIDPAAAAAAGIK